jgi:hypothetical protein
MAAKRRACGSWKSASRAAAPYAAPVHRASPCAVPYPARTSEHRYWHGFCPLSSALNHTYSTCRSTPFSGLKKSSASSSLNFGVEPLQFHAGVLDAELPGNAAVLRMRFVGPRGDFALPFGQCTAATVTQSLACEATQCACGAMQPTAGLRGGADRDALDVRARPGRCEGFIARTLRVRVEIGTHACHGLASSRARVQQVSDCARPGGFRPSDAGSCLPEARERFGAHAHAGGAMALGCVVDTAALRRRRGAGHPRLLEPRDRRFVHAPHRLLRIVGWRRGGESFFPAGPACGVLLRRHPPVRALPLRHAVFFHP